MIYNIIKECNKGETIMLELINVEDLYENDKIIIMDSIFFNNNKLIENIEIGFKNKSGDIIGIKTIKHIK